MFSALPQCETPFNETTVGSGVFYGPNGALCNPCDPDWKWSNAAGMCVMDVQVPGTTPSSFDPKYLLYGLGFLLLVGAFMGGRASRGSSKSSSKLLSRTTTRSIFG